MADILGEQDALHAIVDAVAQECRERGNHARCSVGVELRHKFNVFERVKEEMRIKLRFELTQLGNNACACLLFIFLHESDEALHHAVVLVRDLLELVARANGEFPI